MQLFNTAINHLITFICNIDIFIIKKSLGHKIVKNVNIIYNCKKIVKKFKFLLSYFVYFSYFVYLLATNSNND